MIQKNIVVTGATRGIGRAIAEIFAANGYNVLTCARNLAELEALENYFKLNFPEITLSTYQADLSEKAACLQFVDFVKAKFEKIDILVNNTGIFKPGKIYEEDNSLLESLLNTNVLSAYYISKGLIDGMIAQKNGHIFVINSTASIMAYSNGGSYCITKFALHGMTKVLREELKPFGIKVTSVLPGATYTSSWQDVDLPIERFMQADDVAKMIYAASQLSSSAVMEEILLRPQLGDI